MAEKPPERPFRFTIWYFLALVLLLLVFQMYVLDSRTVNITYSEFRRLVEMNAVDDLRISGDSISGKLLPKGVDYLAEERQDPELPKRLHEHFKEEPVFSTVRLEEPELVERLDQQGISYTAVAERTWLTHLLAWVFPMLLILAIWIYFFRKIGAGAGGIMSVGKSRPRVYVEDETRTTFLDVAGVEEAEEELKEIIEFLKNPGKFQVLGGKIPKGVLLVGPPGTGKTLWPGPWPVRPGCPF
jgi:cell division protease FtsH